MDEHFGKCFVSYVYIHSFYNGEELIVSGAVATFRDPTTTLCDATSTCHSDYFSIGDIFSKLYKIYSIFLNIFNTVIGKFRRRPKSHNLLTIYEYIFLHLMKRDRLIN